MRIENLNQAQKLASELSRVRGQLSALARQGFTVSSYNTAIHMTQPGRDAMEALITSDLVGQEAKLLAELEMIGVVEASEPDLKRTAEARW